MRTRATLTALLIAAAAVACSPPSAQDLVMEVIRTRNSFEVRLTSWLDRGADTSQPYLYLDVEVVKNTEASLTRLTVLVRQLDGSDNVLSEQRVPIDVSDMDVPGLSKKYSLEVRPMHPSVEGVTLVIEPNPDPEFWSDFPELDRVRPRGK